MTCIDLKDTQSNVVENFTRTISLIDSYIRTEILIKHETNAINLATSDQRNIGYPLCYQPLSCDGLTSTVNKTTPSTSEMLHTLCSFSSVNMK